MSRSTELGAVSERELRRIYDRCVVRDFLASAQPSDQPAAMIVAGQPGAGVTYATFQLRKQLAQAVDTAVHVSIDHLRAYHPTWQAGGDVQPLAAFRVTSACQLWFDRLVQDAQRQRMNLVLEMDTGDAKAIPKLAAQLRRDGYIVQAVFVATSREESRIAMMARYEMQRRAGLAVEQPSIQHHALAYANVGPVMGLLEHRCAVDGLRLIHHDGMEIYESRLVEGEPNRPARAQESLDVLRDEAPSPRELVQFAMRWETLVQRLANDPAGPREIASQTLVWRNEAIERCQRNQTAAQLLQWAHEAGAFRVMNRFEFEKEFPHHGRAVKSLGLALVEAERYPREQAERLVLHARENIAQRIERGDMARIAAREKSQESKGSEPERDPPTR